MFILIEIDFSKNQIFDLVVFYCLLSFLQMENPWNVQSIFEFQYFNCPSCDFKNNSKQEFVNHAYEIHPESMDFWMNINDNSLLDIQCPWNELITDMIEIEDSNIHEKVENSIVQSGDKKVIVSDPIDTSGNNTSETSEINTEQSKSLNFFLIRYYL